MKISKKSVTIRQNLFGVAGVRGTLELMEHDEITHAIKRRGLKPKETKAAMVDQLMSHICNTNAKIFTLIK